MIRIIDNKKVDITDDEWNMYQKICKDYDSTTREGKFLFQDLFETDAVGIIQMIKPPTNNISMEVFLFVMALMQHQHIRQMYNIIDGWKKDLEEQFSEKLLLATKKSEY